MCKMIESSFFGHEMLIMQPFVICHHELMENVPLQPYGSV